MNMIAITVAQPPAKFDIASILLNSDLNERDFDDLENEFPSINSRKARF